MPASLKDLRSRIKSVKSTQQITKAMKVVAAAKFARAQSAVTDARPYAASLAQIVSRLARILGGEGGRHPLLMNDNPTPASKNALLIVVSSERGLCGGYNGNVVKQALKTSDELEKDGWKVSYICIGKKACQALMIRKNLSKENKDSLVRIDASIYRQDPSCLMRGNGIVLLDSSFEKPKPSHADTLAATLVKLFADGSVGKCQVVATKFHSALLQTPNVTSVFPVPVSEGSAEGEPIFEPEIEELFPKILPWYFASILYQTFLESAASEHGARMTAMDNATRNAKDMERKLQISYQMRRQAAITNELIEIISGAEAL